MPSLIFNNCLHQRDAAGWALCKTLLHYIHFPPMVSEEVSTLDTKCATLKPKQPKLLRILICFSALSFASFFKQTQHSCGLEWSKNRVLLPNKWLHFSWTETSIGGLLVEVTTVPHLEKRMECATFSLRTWRKKMKQVCASCGRNSPLRTQGETKMHIM